MTPSSLHDDPDETRTPEQRREDQRQRIGALLTRLWDAAPAWRNRLEQAGLTPSELGTVDALSRLTPIAKSDLVTLQAKEPPFGGFFIGDLTASSRIFMSPGPIYDAQLGTTDIGGFARGLRAGGLTRGDIVLNTFAYHLTPAGHAFESGALSLGCVVIPAGTGNTEQQARLLKDVPVTGYMGTPSFLATLVERADWHFRTACVAAEKLTEDERAVLESRGGHVSQLYGTADLGYLAGECVARSGMHLTEDKVVEILDPTTGDPVTDGELGQVTVTTFSPTYPFLRLATGDLTRIVSREPCACGRTSPRIAGVLGRVGPGVKVRGMFVYEHQVGAALSRCGLDAGRLVIGRTAGQDTLTLQIAEPLGAQQEAELVRVLREEIKLRADVEIVSELDPQSPLLVDAREIWQA
ncbi:phenylacetate--CoA ligase family protein [Kineosporiaceae bacterium SCSIO 59966]|nr:phenylacetate--CoA ligase family protein [Kineosporiaceae bacterium SCSIO 59966]